MLCDICHKNSATVHLTEIINEKIIEMHVCQICAQAKAEELNNQINMSGFLGGLAGRQDIKKEDRSIKCDYCGLSYEDFKKEGRLGCGRCYSVFKKQLLPLLKKVHSSTSHVGKKPSVFEEEPSPGEPTIDELRSKLARAIQLEEYEEAAKLRDEIKKREKKEEEQG